MTPAVLAVAALGAGAAGALPPPPRLARLEVSVAMTDAAGPGSGPKRRLRPRFDPETFHYAIRCDDPQTLSVSGAAAAGAAALTLNGAPLSRVFADREVVLRHDQALVVEVSEGGVSAAYAVHCVSRDFPQVWTVARGPRREDGLLLVDPSWSDGVENVGHIAILDDHGVPRFHRRVRDHARNFRWYAAHRMYSYSRRVTGDGGGEERETVLLDEELRPVARPRPVGLSHADYHDFLLTDEGNYLFVVYEPARRDLSGYPVRAGESPYTTDETTIDSVIQEVSPDGEVLFQWNSWESADGSATIRRADCHRLDTEYAWLNSVFLVDGDLVASFRRCSQVLRIERPSGRVRWQLGGSAPAIADGRLHYRIVGDPEEGFCGQHTAIESPPGVVTLFDNATYCSGGLVAERAGRVVEYRLRDGEAVLSRRHRDLHDSVSGGAVQLLQGGGWLVTWGFGRARPHTGAIELDRAGREVFALALRAPRPGGGRPDLYRAYREYGLRVPLNLP